MTAPDLVFLHGGKHGGWCWRPLFEALAARGYEGRLIALDVPGCGTKRGRDTAGYGIEQIARELVDEVAAAGLAAKPVLIGHSMAGIILPRMAVAAPDLFGELVFLTTAAPAEGQPIGAMMGTGLHGANPDEVGWPLDPLTTPQETLFTTMFGEDMTPETLAWVLGECAQDEWPVRASTEPATRADFLGIVPVSYIVTLRDAILPVAWQGRFAERVGAARMFEIDTPHEPMVTHPDLLADLLIGRVLAKE